MITICRRFSLLAVLLLSLKVCFADAPSGTFAFALDNVTTPVLDLSGGFSPANLVVTGAGGSQIPVGISLDLTNNSHGGISGSGATIVTFGEDGALGDGAAFYVATGRVYGGGLHATRVALTVRMIGDGTIGGVTTHFRISTTYNLEFDSASGTLTGNAHGTASFSNVGSGVINMTTRNENPAVVPLNSDGSWGVVLNIVPLNRLGGSATITLQDGRTIQGNLSGSYSPRNGRAILHLTGINDGRGTSLTFILDSTEGGFDLTLLRGSVLGQVIFR